MRPPAMRLAMLRAFVDMANAWPEEFAENFGPAPNVDISDFVRLASPLVTSGLLPTYLDP